MNFMTFHILGRIIPTDELIWTHFFQRGWNHQPDMYVLHVPLSKIRLCTYPIWRWSSFFGTDIPSKDSIIGIPSNYFIYSINMGITINFMITHPIRELTMTQSLTLTQTINHKNHLWPSLTMTHMLGCNIYLTNMPSCLLVKQRFGLVKPYFLDSCAFSSF